MKSMHKKTFLAGFVLLVLVGGVGYFFGQDGVNMSTAQEAEMHDVVMSDKVIKTDAQWKQVLTPEQFKILRKKGTERAFTGKYDKWKEEGIFVCAGCRNPLFSSEHKFDSGTGWPSFWQPYGKKASLKRRIIPGS